MPLDIYSEDTAKQEQALDAIQQERFVLASINTALLNLQAKSYALTEKAAELVSNYGHYDEALFNTIEPVYIARVMQEMSCTEEEARALLSNIPPEESEEFHQQIQEQANNICNGR